MTDSAFVPGVSSNAGHSAAVSPFFRSHPRKLFPVVVAAAIGVEALSGASAWENPKDNDMDLTEMPCEIKLDLVHGRVQ